MAGEQKFAPVPLQPNVVRLSDGSINVAHVITADGIAVAQMMNHGDEMTEAYAHLFAAAPELFEALRNIAGQAGGLRAFELEIREAAGNTNWNCVMDAVAQADAALAKARGEA